MQNLNYLLIEFHAVTSVTWKTAKYLGIKQNHFVSTNRFVEILDQLQTDFSSWFSNVKIHEKSLRLFENPFNIDRNDVEIFR